MKHESMNRYKPLRSINEVKYREPCRNSREAYSMFMDYYGSINSFSTAVSLGKFPAPTLVIDSCKRKRLFWAVSVLEKELKRRRAVV